MTDTLVSIITLILQVEPLKTREKGGMGEGEGALNSLAVALPANMSSSNGSIVKSLPFNLLTGLIIATSSKSRLSYK